MSRETMKHIRFVSDTLRQKPVRAVPGVGPQLDIRLRETGVFTAEQLLGQLLDLNNDKAMFVVWLTSSCGATPTQAEACYNGLMTWTQHFLT